MFNDLHYIYVNDNRCTLNMAIIRECIHVRTEMQYESFYLNKQAVTTLYFVNSLFAKFHVFTGILYKNTIGCYLKS